MRSYKQDEDELRKESKNFIVEYFDYERLSKPFQKHSNNSNLSKATCLIPILRAMMAFFKDLSNHMDSTTHKFKSYGERNSRYSPKEPTRGRSTIFNMGYMKELLHLMGPIFIATNVRIDLLFSRSF